MIAAEFKEVLKSGKPQIGTFIKLANATAVEALGLAGLDFAIIDTEHAPCDQQTLENLIRAADGVNLPVIVRVSDAAEANILKALDLGASGVQIPNLSDVEAVRKAVGYSKYAPLGKRGLSFSQRSAGYGSKDRQQYMEDANAGLLNVVHVENKEMAEQAEALCAMKAVDVLFIGPMDISQSLGHAGNPSHPDVTKVVEKVIQVCRSSGKPTGIFASSVEAAKKYMNMGVVYIALSSEIGFMMDGYKQMKNNCLLCINK